MVVRATNPVSTPAPCMLLVGKMLNTQAAPAWVTVKFWPATASTPTRPRAVGLEATVKLTAPLPVPLVPERVIHGLGLTAFQAHDGLFAVIVTAPEPPPLPTETA